MEQSNFDINNPNRHIRDYLHYYLNFSTPPGFAVMVRGPWGIGKTFLIQKILADQFPEPKDYIYVSLYGVAKPEEIDTLILAAMYPLLKNKAVKIAGRLLNAATQFYNVDGNIKLGDVFGHSTAAVYVFDDIERAKMTADEIFGYINQFVEHLGCRVILVANEAELERTDGYRTKREKLVGQTLEAQSVVTDALDSFFLDIVDTEARDHLASVKDQIVNIYEQGEVNNLRVLKQTLWDFERFYKTIEAHHRKHAPAMLDVLRLLFALSFEIKLGRMDSADLLGRRDRWLASMMSKDGSAIKTSFDRYEGLDLSDTTLSDELLTELLVHGVVDQSLTKRDLNASNWFFEPTEEPSWRTIWYRLERESDLVKEAISTLEAELAEFRYLQPGEILHIFGIKLMMSDAELTPTNRDQVVVEAKAYISKLREQGRLIPLDPNSFLDDFRHGSWGGLGIEETGTPHFSEIYNFLQDQRDLARFDRLPNFAIQLMEELGDDPDLFCRRLVGVGGDRSDLFDGPVLKEIDPDDFLATVVKQPARVQSQVFRCLLSRYQHGGFSQGLEDERAWVQSLHRAMLDLAAESEPVLRSKLAMFSGWLAKFVPTTPKNEDESTAMTEIGQSAGSDEP